MAASSDKVRFYLEQTIPDLQELQRKKVFTKVGFLLAIFDNCTETPRQEEITAITKKRSDFEYKLNARGSQPSDYARYAEYEMNLESLRKKRVKRMGMRVRTHAGQRRIFFVLERATRKFQGDTRLWMQYVEFARKQKSTKKVSEIFTSMLRLHPTRPELWIYAANYALEELEDIVEARSYMQRGLRFCKDSKNLWTEYAKLEMIYIAKLSARARALGRNEEQSGQDLMLSGDGNDGNLIAGTAISAFDGQTEEPVAQEVLKILATTPVLSGAIPMAIFDRAMNQFGEDATLGENFFDMIAKFQDVHCVNKILQHIIDRLLAVAPSEHPTLFCLIRQPVIGVQILSPDFPRALGTSLQRLNSAMTTTLASTVPNKSFHSRSALSRKAIEWILQFFVEALDPDIHQVLLVTLRKLWGKYQSHTQEDPENTSDGFMKLFLELEKKGFNDMAYPARSLTLRLWPNDPKITGL